MRCLVVEDDNDLRRQLARALTDAGYAVDVAEDGEEGRSAEQDLPCLPASLRLAQEMGPRLGRCPLLLGPMPVSQARPEIARHPA